MRNAESIYRAHEARIETAIAFACRRLALRDAEVDELASLVKLRLIEDDYRILRAFEGRSSVGTYLTTVVLNLARDYRIRKWGRWRPSAAAKRLGTVGIQLDTLLHRDGYSLREATEILRTNLSVDLAPTEIADLAAQLPVRGKRWFEGEEVLAGMAGGERADDGLVETEREETLRRAGAVLQEALEDLVPEDRLILKLRFLEGATVASIARSFRVEQRPLYTRIYNALGRLRATLEAAGFDGGVVMQVTGWGDDVLRLDFGEGGEEESVERAGPGPSQGNEGRPEEEAGP
ncbi:MAG: sigma-70 family RNA polymerase sigma factor [Thermoanaerobaculia bacterium]